MLCLNCKQQQAVGWPPGWCTKCTVDLYFKKYEARKATNRAIASGQLVRGRCEQCGAKRVHCHHLDYNKPLEVRWLCRRHHRELHLAERQAAPPGPFLRSK